MATSSDSDCAPSVCGLVGGLVGGSCASPLGGLFAAASLLFPADERERRMASMAEVSALRMGERRGGGEGGGWAVRACWSLSRLQDAVT